MGNKFYIASISLPIIENWPKCACNYEISCANSDIEITATFLKRSIVDNRFLEDWVLEVDSNYTSAYGILELLRTALSNIFLFKMNIDIVNNNILNIYNLIELQDNDIVIRKIKKFKNLI